MTDLVEFEESTAIEIDELSEGDSSETAREIERIPSYITDWPGSDKTYISRLVSMLSKNQGASTRRFSFVI